VWDSRAASAEQEAGGWQLGEVDPFAGGHPVPPLPGQSVAVTRGPRERALAGATPASEEDLRG
jgi:NADH-quinone oxidoreductase subunit H